METTTSDPVRFNPATQKQLARLLSRENIRIRIGNYDTAFFDTKNRVLGLPTWNFKSKFVSDLLIVHETGHALFTPEDGRDQFEERFPGKPFSICNIIEDTREENLMMKEYPGTILTFKRGYEELLEMDLFQIADKDVSTLGFADRLNIRSKSRRTDLVPLSEKEEDFYQRTNRATTFEEVLDLCEEAFKMIEDERARQQEEEGDGQEGSASEGDECGDGQAGAGDSDESEDTPTDSESTPTDGEGLGENKDDTQNTSHDAGGKELNAPQQQEDPDATTADDLKTSFGQEGTSSPTKPGDYDHDLESITQDALDRGLNENTYDYDGNNLVELGSDKELLDHIVDLPELRAARQEYLDRYNNAMSDANIHQHWVEFKNRTKQYVAILAKEFERRKAAFQYSRATVARTGQLDVNKLHSYKYDDQLFRSMTQLADAKSHGMIFVIDYSGSMNSQISNVIAQTLQLVMFCKAVNIPFEVYAFTTPTHNCGWYGTKENSHMSPGVHVDLDGTQVVELLNSNLKKREFEDSMKELWIQSAPQRTINSYNDRHDMDLWGWHINPFKCKYEEMSGTPLNQTLLITHAIVKRFRRQHRVQKTNLIILTDGDGGWMHTVENSCDKAYRKQSKPAAYHRKMVTELNGKLVEIDGDAGYVDLISSLKKMPGVTVIGFFIAPRQKEARSQLRRAISNSRIPKADGFSRWNIEENIVKEARKRKLNFFEVRGGYGYDCYYIMKDSSSTEIHDENLLDEMDAIDATAAADRSRLARTFTKMTGDKRATRVFLNKFAELIA